MTTGLRVLYSHAPLLKIPLYTVETSNSERRELLENNGGHVDAPGGTASTEIDHRGVNVVSIV